jgi:hypothetical protein
MLELLIMQTDVMEFVLLVVVMAIYLGALAFINKDKTDEYN